MAKEKKNCYIAIAGIMGSGKTTASRILAEELGVPLIEEKPEENPFLADFYKDMKRWALHIQLFYILKKIEENIEAKKVLISSHLVHDAPSGQDLIYGKVQKKFGHVTANEHKLIKNILRLYKSQMINPDLMVFLDAPIELILKRIDERGRDYERDVSRDYISSLHGFQKEWLESYPENKKIVVNMSKLDLKKGAGRKVFVETVKKFIEKK